MEIYYHYLPLLGFLVSLKIRIEENHFKGVGGWALGGEVFNLVKQEICTVIYFKSLS